MQTCSQVVEYVELYWAGLITTKIPSDIAWWYWFNCEIMV